MPITINRQTYYRTSETCRIAGISKATLARWLKAGIIEDAAHKDRRGWRLFTRGDVNRIKAEASRISRIPVQGQGKGSRRLTGN